MAGLELVQQVQDPRAPLERVVELEMELRDALDPEPLAELVLDERHRPTERRQRRLPIGRLADDADEDLGMAKIRRRLDARHRREAHPRIGDLARDDHADLLPKQLVDPVSSRWSSPLVAASLTCSGVRTRLTVCEEKHSMMSPSSSSWKLARPMPHS